MSDIYAEGDMRRRKDRGAALVSAYGHEMFGLDEDREDVLLIAGDLIADVLHFVNYSGLDPEEAVRRGRFHYEGDFEDVGGVPIS